ncbi:MAG: hypothetical protein ACI8W8_003541 [Rhodothermales bacterium]|jgi:hypothetical protein
MATLNRTLNLLIFVAALVALGFTLALNERRLELREHSETLASTLAAVSTTLSENSGTTQHEQLTADGLGWQRFHELRSPQSGESAAFQKMLEDAVAQAEDLREQRDMLAQSLADVGERFQIDGASAENLQLLADSADFATEMVEKLSAIDRRDRNTARAIAALSRNVGHDLQSDDLLDVDRSEAELDSLTDHVQAIDLRSAQLAETMAQIVSKIDLHQFETNPDRLRGADYASELASLLNDFDAINESLADFAQTKAELAEKERLFEETTIALNDTELNIANLQSRNDNLRADADYWKLRYEQLVVISEPPTAPPTRTTAAVLDVNYDWNYITIDIGAEHKLQPTTEMTLAREDQFICNVRVSKVYDRYAVAEVLPKLRQGQVLAGDRVLF